MARSVTNLLDFRFRATRRTTFCSYCGTSGSFVCYGGNQKRFLECIESILFYFIVKSYVLHFSLRRESWERKDVINCGQKFDVFHTTPNIKHQHYFLIAPGTTNGFFITFLLLPTFSKRVLEGGLATGILTFHLNLIIPSYKNVLFSYVWYHQTKVLCHARSPDLVHFCFIFLLIKPSTKGYLICVFLSLIRNGNYENVKH